MTDIQKKVFLDLFVTPFTVTPAVIGATVLLIGWAGGFTWGFLGVGGLLVAVGAVVTNWIFNLENITVNAIKEERKQKEGISEKQLDALDRKLVTDRDPRDQTCLRNLRSAYLVFKKDQEDGKIAQHVDTNPIDELFKACVKSLERSFELYLQTKKFTGPTKKKLKVKRDKLLKEIGKSVEQFMDNVANLRSLEQKPDDLETLRKQLTDSLEIAKSTEEKFTEGYEEWLKE